MQFHLPGETEKKKNNPVKTHVSCKTNVQESQMGFISIIYLVSRAVYQKHIQIILSL